MDRAILEQSLREAKSHATLGEQHIERQEQIIRDLELGEHDTALARQLLQTYQESQALHVADVERLQKEIAALAL